MKFLEVVRNLQYLNIYHRKINHRIFFYKELEYIGLYIILDA